MWSFRVAFVFHYPFFLMLWITIIHFFSSLFPAMANDHILGLSIEVTSTFEFLAYQLQATGFLMQPHKCIVSSSFNFLVDFKTPFSFNILLVGVKVHFKTPFSFNIPLAGVEVDFKTPFSFNIPLINVKVLGILIFKPSRLYVKKCAPTYLLSTFFFKIHLKLIELASFHV